jgi:hypothetical protein
MKRCSGRPSSVLTSGSARAINPTTDRRGRMGPSVSASGPLVIPLAYFGFNPLCAAGYPSLHSLRSSWRLALIVAGTLHSRSCTRGLRRPTTPFVAGGLLLVYSLYYALSEGVSRALADHRFCAEVTAGYRMRTYTTTSVGPGAQFSYRVVLAAVAAMARRCLPEETVPSAQHRPIVDAVARDHNLSAQHVISGLTRPRSGSLDRRCQCATYGGGKLLPAFSLAHREVGLGRAPSSGGFGLFGGFPTGLVARPPRPELE